MHLNGCFVSLVVVLAYVVSPVTAGAETVNCTAITALPAVITMQGIYCLTADLSTAMTLGPAIEIQASNVVVDLNGFKLGGLAAGSGTCAVGIYALNRQNITVKNGTIRGFVSGIALATGGGGLSEGHVVEDIRADHNTRMGISVDGSGTIIRNNHVLATGGSANFAANVDAFGIYVTGTGPRVLNNDVMHTVKQGAGVAYGIIFTNGVTGGLAVNNRITEADKGIFYDVAQTGKYRDNLTFAVSTPFAGGTDAGNNN